MRVAPWSCFTALEVGRQGVRLNVDAGDGMVRVALLDEQGNVLPGRSIDEFIPLEGDVLNHKPRWRAAEANAALPSKIRLRIELVGNAKLYGIKL